MPSVPRPGKVGKFVEMPAGLVDQFQSFAEGRGSTFTREVLEAMRRHMAHPPSLEPAPFPAENQRRKKSK